MASNEDGRSKPARDDRDRNPGEAAGKAAVKGETPSSGDDGTAPKDDQGAIDLDLAHDRAS